MPQTKEGAARNPWLQYLRSVSQGYRASVAAEKEAPRLTQLCIKPYVPKRTRAWPPAKVVDVEAGEKEHLLPKRQRQAEAATCQQSTLLPFAVDASVRKGGEAARGVTAPGIL